VIDGCDIRLDWRLSLRLVVRCETRLVKKELKHTRLVLILRERTTRWASSESCGHDGLSYSDRNVDVTGG
jgi:hypothetical protein